MATIRQIKETGYWQIRFYWQGRQCQRSCGTKQRANADRTLASVEDTIHLLRTGRLQMPADVDPFDWIVSGGKIQAWPASRPEERMRFGDLCDAYLKDQKRKEQTTLRSEMLHIRHLKRLLRSPSILHKISLEDLKRYRRQRSRQTFRGKLITDVTIKKELVTFRQIWMWAKRNDYIKIPCPLQEENGRWKLEFEKPESREKFQTWDQIERRISRGALAGREATTLWEGLYFDALQVCELLEYVKSNARHAFINPMFAFAAYTGARRSEILRSEIEDFDCETDHVIIRERKRRKDRKGSTRLVPVHPKLREVMQVWFANHPGGRFTIAPPAQMIGRPRNVTVLDHLPPHQAHYHFKTTLQNSKWSVVPGFHVLRHSFGSNLIRSGKVSSDVVAKWMGHTTVEMRELYQHLFPQDGPKQIAVLA